MLPGGDLVALISSRRTLCVVLRLPASEEAHVPRHQRRATKGRSMGDGGATLAIITVRLRRRRTTAQRATAERALAPCPRPQYVERFRWILTDIERRVELFFGLQPRNNVRAATPGSTSRDRTVWPTAPSGHRRFFSQRSIRRRPLGPAIQRRPVWRGVFAQWRGPPSRRA